MKKLILILALLLFPYSLQAQAEGEAEKVCFCHNINHNPHTICTANQALVNAHMDHVDGNVPGVLDSLGECTEEGDDDGNVDDDDDGDTGDDGDDGTVDDGEDGDSNDENAIDDDDFGSLPQIGDGSTGSTVGSRGMLFEGSGCSLNRAAAQGADSWTWLALLMVPLVFAGLRRPSKAN